MEAQPLPEVSLVVPVYNERDRVVTGLTQIVEYASALPWTTEVVVVDDGSTDERVCRPRPAAGRPGGRVAQCLATRGRYRWR